MATKKIKSAATTKKAAPKATKVAKKTVKKSSPEFERAVKTATWCTVGFAIMEMIWSTLGYGLNIISLIVFLAMGAMAVAVKVAHDKKNNGLVLALSSGLSLLIAYVVIEEFIIKSSLVFSVNNVLGTITTVVEFILAALFITFVVTHFIWVGKKSKMTIKVNRKVNFLILLFSVICMVIYGAAYGTTEPVLLVSDICFLAFGIFSTDLVQRIEEGA